MRFRTITLAIFLFAFTQLMCIGALAIQENDRSSVRTFKGVVSDSQCGNKKHMAADSAKCIRGCVKSGSDFSLVVGTKVYILKGDKTELDKLAGEHVTVKGKVSGDTITVESIASVKG